MATIETITLQLLKVVRWGATNQLKTLCLTVLSIFIFSCSTRQTAIVTKKGGQYEYRLIKRKLSSNPVVKILVTSLDNNSNVLIPTIMVDRMKSPKSNPNGTFEISVLPGKHRFMGKGMSSLFVETQTFTLNKGDSLNIVFNLKPDHSNLEEKR